MTPDAAHQRLKESFSGLRTQVMDRLAAHEVLLEEQAGADPRRYGPLDKAAQREQALALRDMCRALRWIVERTG